MIKRLLKRLFTPGDRLSQRVVHAGFWVFALRIIVSSILCLGKSFLLIFSNIGFAL